VKPDSEAFFVGCSHARRCAGNLFSVHAASLETWNVRLKQKRNKLYFSLGCDFYASIALHYVTLHYSNKFCEDGHISSTGLLSVVCGAGRLGNI
jgi:hypothetical protein